MNHPTIDIVIVNWNAGTLLYDCVNSITIAMQDGFIVNRVVVVDNDSKDNSIELLKPLLLPLFIIQNPVNHGFCKACNQGAKDSKADYILFLNPDTRLFKNSLVKPLAFMEESSNASVGITSIQLLNAKNEISRSCSRFPHLYNYFNHMFGLNHAFPKLFPYHMMTDWAHDYNRMVDQVIGAFLLVRRELFEKLNGFDERFFVYFEDLDFSLRAKKLGFSSIFLADAQAYHKGQGTSDQVKATRLFYSLRSRILYGYKHFNVFSATILMLATLLIEPINRSILAILKRSRAEFKETLLGSKMLWLSLPAIIQQIHSGKKI